MIKDLIKKYRMYQIVVIVYYSQVNEMMKRDYKLIINLLAKLSAIKRRN